MQVLIATWLLVAVGAVTAGFICWQALVSKQAAKAAQTSAEALINNERPWVLLEDFRPPGNYWSDVVVSTANQGMAAYAVPRFKNYGNTPAWITQSTAFLKITDDQHIEQALDYGQPPPYPSSRSLPPGQEREYIVHLDAEHVLNSQEIRILESGAAYLILYGFLRYRDPFFEQKKQEHETRFCLRFWVQKKADGGTWGRWDTYGPSGANAHT